MFKVRFLFYFLFPIVIHGQSNVSLYYQYLAECEVKLQSKEFDSAYYFVDLPLDQQIDYGYDAFKFFNRYLENLKVSDTIAEKNFENYCFLLARSGIPWKDISNFGKKIIRYGDPFRAEILKSDYIIFSDGIKFNDLVNKKKCDENYLIYKNSTPAINRILLKEVKRIDRIDQRVRKRKNSHDFRRADSMVYNMLLNIVKREGGFPSFYLLGKEGYEIIGTVLSHMTAERLASLLPELQKGIEKGEIFIKDDVLYSIDRVAIEDGEYIVYRDNEYQIIESKTKCFGKYHFSAIGTFYFTTHRSKTKYLFPINPMLSTDELALMRSIFFLPAIDQFVTIHKIKILDAKTQIEFFKNNTIKVRSFL